MVSTPTASNDGKAACPADADAKTLLSEGSLIDPTISARPNWYYAAMRSEDPVHYDEKLGMYLISRYDDIQQVQRDPVTIKG